MKVLMTGANNPFGHEVLAQFDTDSLSLSRTNSFDISDPAVRTKISEMSLQYDIFINHAHNGHFSGQTELLYQVFETWKNANKQQGLIVSTSSIASNYAHREFKRYAVIKKGLEFAHQQITKVALDQGLAFRTVLIQPGTLGNGGTQVSGKAYAQVIKSIYHLAPNIFISEIQLNGEVR